jgi:hypothetical protein
MTVTEPIRIDYARRAYLKTLLALSSTSEAEFLSYALEERGHRVITCTQFNQAVKFLNSWEPGLVVLDEQFDRQEANSGVRLSNIGKSRYELVPGATVTKFLMLIPSRDRNRFQQAKACGAYGIEKSANFEKVIRYIDTFADDLWTDRIVGPVLLAIHECSRSAQAAGCTHCKWRGALLSYGPNERDIDPPRVLAALLGILSLHRRGLPAEEIVRISTRLNLTRDTLQGHQLSESSLKMEVSRLRDFLGAELVELGTDYLGAHFLPPLNHGCEKYRLRGNFGILHVSKKIVRSRTIQSKSELSGIAHTNTGMIVL